MAALALPVAGSSSTGRLYFEFGTEGRDENTLDLSTCRHAFLALLLGKRGDR